jgi:membrane fusion protein
MSHSILTLLFSVVAATIVAFLVFGSYTRKVDVRGILAPSQGLIKVIPSRAGLISDCRVKEGQSVKAGDVLFVLSSERETAGQGSAETAISELLKARRDSLQRDQDALRLQFSQRLDAAHRRAEDMGAEARRIDEQISLQQRRVQMAGAALKRFSDLAADNFVSQVQVEGKQADMLDQEQRLSELQRARATSARELSTAQAEVRDLQVQAVRDQQAGDRNMATTEQELTENEARRQILVSAPADGIVTAITADAGQSVSGNQPLAAILPKGSELEAELYAPSRAVGFLRPGMTVQLRYQAYSYQKFGQARGRVREISRTALRPEELNLPFNLGTGEPVYRVRVALDRQSVPAYGVEQPLRSGATLDGNILLEKRRLYEWVLEPLYTITGTLCHGLAELPQPEFLGQCPGSDHSADRGHRVRTGLPGDGGRILGPYDRPANAAPSFLGIAQGRHLAGSHCDGKHDVVAIASAEARSR